ncbi:shikimate dehydrogenase [Jannaschia aquimarina]|uniref:Shikimate dehydrogenase (NADP(+)) n=1 Tax=Jannaschia aquimarina TaxID=935700 RepID=A0A0D1EB33_9RHOB|nr:shikimate dehydrogenase [Jannaschia aquimarina]KIT14964.1 Shikimate dehydrogenase [Jannaschia aquimarina]SNS60610.1 shikimate dehydrogenase [Jannaschia aquimarina]
MILAAVLGDPISHSRSPRLHGHWIRRHRIDGAYVPLHVSNDDLLRVLDLLPGLGFAGCNITIPHKEAALAVADQVTDRARRIGAVNTLTFKDQMILADNTDGEGFLSSLDAGADWPKDRPAVVLGAGGAARGIVDALVSAGVPEVRIVNRTHGRAEVLAERFDRCVAQDEAELGDAGLLVNTTSLGMEGQPPLDLDLAYLPDAAVVTDIVYTPLETPLLRAARERGLATVDGLGMLLHQAVPGFEAWFGVRPQVDADLRRAVLG